VSVSVSTGLPGSQFIANVSELFTMAVRRHFVTGVITLARGGVPVVSAQVTPFIFHFSSWF
jgi:hypothetical protein